MIKSFMEFVQLKNEGIFDLFKSKKKLPKSPADNAPKSPADNAPKSPADNAPKSPATNTDVGETLDTTDPNTTKYSHILDKGGHSFVNYNRMSPDEQAAAEDQFKKNSADVYYGKKNDLGIKALLDQGNPVDKFKKLEDDIKYGKFSYNTKNIPEMILYMLNYHMDGSYMPFFGSLVKNDVVNMIPYNLALRIMELDYKSNYNMMIFKSFIARHFLEKTPEKIKNIEELNPIFRSLVPTEGWKAKSNAPSFLQHIKEEDIKDIWLKFFEKRPDLAQNYYKETGERMRLNQKYKQTNDTRYQKPNDMENAISIIVGEKNESFNPYKKTLHDW